jgi:hypothetical protein
MNTMTDHEIRIAMAELDGFTDIKIDDCEHVDIDARSVSEWQELRGTVDGDRKGVPDYLNDLNAVHRVEMVLTNNQRRTYAEILVQVHPLQYDPTNRPITGDHDGYMKLFLIANMTARQRCEAILRTVGKWKE